MQTNTTAPAAFITPAELLQHWQGHRALTRRTIEAFPEEEFQQFSIGGMRPFLALALEMISIAAIGIRGAVTGQWRASEQLAPRVRRDLVLSRAETLAVWDEVTAEIEALWPQIPDERFHQRMLAFGQYEGTLYSIVLYWIDNEVHHRGQGYVYLRALGIEPPYFWERELSQEQAS